MPSQARSKSMIARKIAVLAVASTVAVSAAMSSFSAITQASNPAFSLRANPDNPVALVWQADADIERAAKEGRSIAPIATQARRSLAAQALNPSALRQLAYVASEQGDQKHARELIALSTRLSRRDFGARLWLIEDAVARGDIAGALRHYDIAFRTSSKSAEVLFPTLTAALDDPAIRAAFVPYMKASPPWLPAFLADAIGRSSNPAALALLGIEAHRFPSSAAYPDLDLRLLEALILKRQYGAARDFFLSTGQRDPSLLADARLRAPGQGSPFDWQVFDEAAFGASRGNTGGIAIFANAGEQGLVARKLLYLKGGTYRLNVSFNAVSLADKGFVQLRMICLATQSLPVIWTSELLRPVEGANLSANVSVAGTCPVQSLEIVAGGGDGQVGSELEIGRIGLHAVSPGIQASAPGI